MSTVSAVNDSTQASAVLTWLSIPMNTVTVVAPRSKYWKGSAAQSTKQLAAVITTFGAMSDPPQWLVKDPISKTTRNGYFRAGTCVPPAIRGCATARLRLEGRQPVVVGVIVGIVVGVVGTAVGADVGVVVGAVVGMVVGVLVGRLFGAAVGVDVGVVVGVVVGAEVVGEGSVGVVVGENVGVVEGVVGL